MERLNRSVQFCSLILASLILGLIAFIPLQSQALESPLLYCSLESYGTGYSITVDLAQEGTLLPLVRATIRQTKFVEDREPQTFVINLMPPQPDDVGPLYRGPGFYMHLCGGRICALPEGQYRAHVVTEFKSGLKLNEWLKCTTPG